MDGNISSGFRPSNRPNHNGIDLTGPYNVADVIVYAAYSGTVDRVGWSDDNDHDAGLGYHVRVRSGTTYYLLKVFSKILEKK